MAEVEAIKTYGMSTLAIHGDRELREDGALHVPLYNHSTFGFPSTQAVLDVVEGRRTGNLYTRYGLNPTIRAIESKLALLEGAEAAYVFSSGMAAEAATFLAYCQSGDHIICIGDVYGGTFELLGSNLPQLGIETSFLLVNELDSLSEAIRERTRLIFFETPTNPNMEVISIASVVKTARERGVLVVVDNTFASPVNQAPLALGADIVIHSTTKYLGGHSDLTGGTVLGSKDLLAPIWTWRKNLGQMMAPEVAFLLDRSLRTLVLRVRQQNSNAHRVAEFMASHPRVKKVNYPGLESDPYHEIAKQQMSGFGGMVSFVYDGDAQDTARCVDRLKLFSIAPSLGGVESLVTQPVTTTHYGIDDEDRKRRGIVGGLVRLSCGVEDVEDLIDDLRQAFQR